MRIAPVHEVLSGDSSVPSNEADPLDNGNGLLTARAEERLRQLHPHLDSRDAALMLFEAWLRQNHGNAYRLIRNPAEFRRRYDLSRLRAGNGVSAAQCAPEYARYDISEVNEPVLENDIFRCYIEDMQRNVPYRVEIPWPARIDIIVDFLLLPPEDGGDDWI